MEGDEDRAGRKGEKGEGRGGNWLNSCIFAGEMRTMSNAADRNAVEQAYAFFHQKLKVYEHSTSEREMDHIEDTISTYADAMSPAVFRELSGGDPAFLHEHSTFLKELQQAVGDLESLLG